ncbi:GLUT4 regulating protein TUG-domain-containing protein [Microdochium trichocladiopsis]|uniref:GLUT4 regulating protein TUG-domain-containing protein n=1 Tax=Microdochium trichocladiopsis TaxID=1682393 RepID=A0A9P9BTD3_9PEZI|nr:GLUT4 regulating protein TUG-domain-containing protein [Microdochium trichocladiopsis]KAH7035372.1 GLUT4 regulating protein TUG-domain-containing protein [Microdochium trichocladiopsis]
MASNVKVVGTDLRQVVIKVNPSTRLTEVLEQACEKLKVSPARFQLRHKSKLVDLSHTYRTSGLVQGARLELVARSNTPTPISVALQLPPPEGGRLTKKLPSDYTIWKVLRQFESEKDAQGRARNFTERGIPATANGSGSGQLYYETPVVQLGNDTQKLSTFTDFQKTLSQLGYNTGGVLLRLSFQRTERTFFEATTEIDQYFKEDVADKQPANAETQQTQSSEVLNTQTESTSQSEAASSQPVAPQHESTLSTGVGQQMELTSGTTPRSEEPVREQASDENTMVVGPPPTSTEARPIRIYEAPSSTAPAAAVDKDADEAFVPGIEQARAHQSLLKSLGENKRLLSDRELEEKAAAQKEALAKTQQILIRVRHPDNTMFEREYGQDDTGSVLYADVRSQMANPTAAFKLVIPPRELIRDTNESAGKLITGYKLRTNTLVNFVWDESVSPEIRKKPFLKDSAASKAQQVRIPDIPDVASKANEAGNGSSMTGMPAQSKPSASGDGSGFKKPKWLKGFSKK